MNDANKSRNKQEDRKIKKIKKKEGHMVHAVPPKYMGYVFHAREQVATTDRTGYDQRHYQSPQSWGRVSCRGKIWAG